MKSFLTIIILVWLLSPMGQAHPSQPFRIDEAVKFDVWGDILFSDEKARLDNAALYVHNQVPRNIIYLVVYAGQRACVGEAKARGIRAKKHLVSRGIPPDQVVWIDGGHKREVTTEVWVWPPDVGKPSVSPDLELSDVDFDKNCKIKSRRRPSRGMDQP